MYKVLISFADLKDGKYIYEKGDVYPHEGYKPTEDRITELSGNENAFGQPIIAKQKSKK